MEPAGEAIAWITLDSPERRNAFDADMVARYRAAVERVDEDRSIRVAIVRSKVEKVFVAGGDIAAMRDLDLPEAERFVYAGHAMLRSMEESGVVFIAAIEGFALGGGMELALACDLVVAGEAAVFGLPEVTLGLFPGWGGTQRLARAVGEKRAKEWILSGERVTADEAWRVGVVNRIAPAGAADEAALELARRIAANAPFAVRQAKKVVNHGSRASLDQGLVLEAEAWLANLASPDRVEGLTAFLEKRKPRFQGGATSEEARG